MVYKPRFCRLCFMHTKALMEHLDPAQRCLACPLFSLEVGSWMQFQSGWQATQRQVVSIFWDEMVERKSYSYCGKCLIEVCWANEHDCLFMNHDQDACAVCQDCDDRWLVWLAYLVLRKVSVRKQIAKTLTSEDVTLWDACQWGVWVSHPYISHLSRASVVVVGLL